MQIGAAPQAFTWIFPICPHHVTIAVAAIRVLQHAAAASPHPQQGLLLGRRRPGVTYIDACRPLASLDAETLSGAIEQARQPVVGFYRIRDGSAFIFDPVELELGTTLFPEPGSVVLLVERRADGPAEGAFAFWRGDTLVSNLPQPFAIDPGILPVNPLPPVRASEEEARTDGWWRRNARAVTIVAAATVSVAILPLCWERQPEIEQVAADAVPASSPGATLRPHGDVEIQWDRQQASSASGALLRIVDGPQSRYVPLDRAQVRLGSMRYSPVSSPVSFEMKVLQSDGAMVDVPVSATAAAAVPAPPAAVVAVKAPAAAPAPREQTAAVPPAAKRIPDLVRTPAKKFQLASIGRPSGGGLTLPDAPAIHATLAPAVATLPVLSFHSAPVAHPAGSASGRLIWTGTLLRRGVVEFDRRTVSIGSLTGGLPGLPVNVTVSPAEFRDDGLIVYTSDPKMDKHREPPSAGNGWNRITYIWDPDRARQIAVLETPNPSNRFSHLALRSDARRLSMLVIDWAAR